MNHKKLLTLGQILDIGLIVAAVLMTAFAVETLWGIYMEFKPHIGEYYSARVNECEDCSPPFIP